MRDPKTVPKLPLYLRLSKSLTYLCFSVILFSTSAVTWAQELEGSIPNENGDYCVIFPLPPVIPKGGDRVSFSIWSSTSASTADINGKIVHFSPKSTLEAELNDSSYQGSVMVISEPLQETTLFTLTVVPETGSEYSCSTQVTVLESFSVKPTESSCLLTGIPLFQYNEEGKVLIYFSLSWDKFENNPYWAGNYSINDGNTNKFRREHQIQSSCRETSCIFNKSLPTGGDSINIADFPATYTAKIFWKKTNEEAAWGHEPYNVVSKCSTTIEGMLPAKLPVTSQPVQPTKLTYNDGLQAGKQQCIDDPGACGITSSSGIRESCMPVIYDAVTNVLSIPEVQIPVISGDTFSFDLYEALLSVVPAPDNSLQLKVDKMSQLNKPASDEEPASDENRWRDHPDAAQAIEVTKLYLTLDNRDSAVSIINELQKAGEFVNGIAQYSGDPTGQVLYLLEFFLRNSSSVLAGDLVAEGSIVRAAKLIENDTGLAAAAELSGSIRDLNIFVTDGWMPLFSTVSDVEVKIYQVTRYVLDNGVQKYIQSPSNTMYEGKYLSSGLGHSFKSEIPSGLYIVEISRDGDVLKVKPIFLERKDKLTFTIPL